MITVLSVYMNLMSSIKNEEGQDLVEYALLLGLIAIAAVVAIGLAGTSVAGFWDTISATLGGITVTQ